MSVVHKHALRHELYREKWPRSYAFVIVPIVFVFLLLAYAFFALYLGHGYTGAARLFAHVVPIPAAIVEGDVIWYAEVAEFANVFDRARAEEGADVPDPFQAALDRAVSNAHLRSYAESIGVQVTRSDVQSYVIDDEDFETFLHDVHWSESRYRRLVIEPLLYAQAAEAIVYDDAAQQIASSERVTNVKRDLERGIRFEDLAIQYSDDPSGTSGGFLGFYTKDAMPSGLEEVFDDAVRTPSEILDTDGAFVIAQIYDTIIIDGERAQVALQIISIKKTGLAPVLETYVEGRKVWYLVR